MSAIIFKEEDTGFYSFLKKNREQACLTFEMKKVFAVIGTAFAIMCFASGCKVANDTESKVESVVSKAEDVVSDVVSNGKDIVSNAVDNTKSMVSEAVNDIK